MQTGIDWAPRDQVLGCEVQLAGSALHGQAGLRQSELPLLQTAAEACVACNLTLALTAHAGVQPQADALQVGERVLSYAALDDGVWRAAAWLRRQGVAPGDVIAVQLRDQVALALAMLGLMRLGATPLPLSPTATPHQLAEWLADAGVQRMLADPGAQTAAPCAVLSFDETQLAQEELAPGLACEQPEAPCLMIVGSGSTGKPRLMPVTHAQMRARCLIIQETWGFGDQDRVMLAAPLHFATPIFLVLAAIHYGATGIVWSQSGDLGQSILEARPQVLHLSVFHAEAILLKHSRHHSCDLSGIRVVSIGASTISEDLRRRLRSGLKARLHVHYGTNEVFPVCFAYPPDLESVAGVVGRPPGGVAVEIVDADHRPLGPGQIGRVRVRSPAQISAYLGGGDAERFRDGWFYPGDLAEWAPDGQLVHCGRADQMMIMNGVNIYPAEIERALGAHPAVREVLAFPLQHAVAQEVPVCAVVLHEGTQASTSDLQRFARARLGARAPQAVAVLPAIPRNEQGKPLRAELTQQVRALLGRGPGRATPSAPPPVPVPVPTGAPRSRQRRRRIAFDFTPPAQPQACALAAWRALLGAAPARPGGPDAPAAPAGDQAVMAWLDEVLQLAGAMLREARVPVFEPLVALQGERLVAGGGEDGARWRALIEVPVLDHLPAPGLEPLLAAALEAALRVAAWTQQQPEGRSGEPQGREAFYDWVDRQALAGLRKRVPAGKSTLNVLAACHARGVPWADLGGGIYQLGWGARARRIDRSTTDGDSAMGARVARDKAWTARLLRAAALPAAVHEVVRTVEAARAAGARLGWPLVVKPADAERGEGVHMDVGPHGIEAAFAQARDRSPGRRVLVERQVAGVCHRVFIAAGRLLYAVRRLPTGVYGDGRCSVEELLRDACAREAMQPPWRRTPIRPLDDPARAELARQGLRADSVPESGRFVALRRIETTAWGGVDEDVTATIHPENVRVAMAASALCGLEVAGVDLISPDITQPWHVNGAVINEVNFAPLLGEAAISRRQVPEFIARLLGGDGRIPVEVFVGDEGAAAAARGRAAQLRQQGLAAVVSSHAWTEVGEGQALALAANGLHARTRALILSPAVEALVLVVQNDELLDSGLPLEGVDAVRVVNRQLGSRQPAQALQRQRALLQQLAGWVWPRAAQD